MFHENPLENTETTMFILGVPFQYLHTRPLKSRKTVNISKSAPLWNILLTEY